MRKPIPVRIVAGLGLNARHIGFPWHSIEVGAAAVNALGTQELLAVVAHERGHYELYHSERQVGIWLTALVSGVALVLLGQPWIGAAVFLGARLAANMLFLTYEFEADEYAANAVSPKAMISCLSSIAYVDRAVCRRLARLANLQPGYLPPTLPAHERPPTAAGQEGR